MASSSAKGAALTLLGVVLYALGAFGAPSECIDCLKVEQADRKDYNWKFGDGTPTDPQDPAASEHIRSLERQHDFWLAVTGIGVVLGIWGIVKMVKARRVVARPQ